MRALAFPRRLPEPREQTPHLPGVLALGHGSRPPEVKVEKLSGDMGSAVGTVAVLGKKSGFLCARISRWTGAPPAGRCPQHGPAARLGGDCQRGRRPLEPGLIA